MGDILDLFYKREGVKIYRRSLAVQKILEIDKARRSNLPEEHVDGLPRRRSARSRSDTSWQKNKKKNAFAVCNLYSNDTV